MQRVALRVSTAIGATALIACAGAHVASAPTPEHAIGASTRQLIVVVTSDWDAVNGTLYRFQRAAGRPWQSVGQPYAIVVGKTGIGWGVGVADWRTEATAGEPVKREGDGRAPAGIFRLGTAFGFAPADSLSALRLPYLALTGSTECVDDTRSSHYNTLVDRGAFAAPDWSSAEHMRGIKEYQLGIVVEHNADPPVPGRGSCIFVHIWDGPDVGTAGCTAMPSGNLTELVGWLDPADEPLLVQLPQSEYRRHEELWALPAVPGP
jgi:D-alanyl-D-alanine dipeptidase